ncbi:MAG TPA: hypothetical protein VK783_02925 [Bacteroidia bacterium]|jgi:hypothetical protein|nr:hypothetical protein [Bacteroidia bacterium]
METKEVKTDNGLITGMFPDRESAEKAYNSVSERGYTKDEVSLIMSDETKKKYYSGYVKETVLGTKAADGAGKGSAIGGVVGAAVGILAAVGTSLVIPGLGLVIAGPLAAGIAGVGAGGLTGGIIGALIGAGIPEARSRIYEEGVKKGHIVLGVHPRNVEDANHIEKSWLANNGQEIHHESTVEVNKHV